MNPPLRVPASTRTPVIDAPVCPPGARAPGPAGRDLRGRPVAGKQKMPQPADVLTANAPQAHRRKPPGNLSYGWQGGATPQPQRGTGASSTTSAPGWELLMASRVPHSRYPTSAARNSGSSGSSASSAAMLISDANRNRSAGRSPGVPRPTHKGQAARSPQERNT